MEDARKTKAEQYSKKNKKGFTVGGYNFATTLEAQNAKEEMQAIRYLCEKTDINDVAQAYVLYNKIIEKELFKTQVGMDFLNKLQKSLINNPSVPNDRIQPIPVRTDIEEAIEDRREADAFKLKNKHLSDDVKRFKTYFTRSLIVNFLLIIIVISMMIIAATSNNPNILNYESKLQDRYASWEENLKAREAVIKEKELSLGIK